MENYLDCTENAVYSFCNREAADLLRKIYSASLEPQLTAAPCKGWGKIISYILPLV